MRALLLSVASVTLAVSLAAGCHNSLSIYPNRAPERISVRYAQGHTELRWNAVPGASGYVVYGSKTSPVLKATADRMVVPAGDVPNLATGYSDQLGLLSGEKLHVAMTTLSGNSESDLSSEVETTVLFLPLSLKAVWDHAGEAQGDRFGSAVATGDVNGDGIPDLVIGAPDGGVNTEGVVYTFLGTPLGLSTSADPRWTLAGGAPKLHFGKAIALAKLGFDEGVFDDLVVGAPVEGGPGLMIVYRNSFLGFNPSNAYAQRGGSGGGSNDDGFGSALAIVDLNHDGHPDIVCGAPGFGNGSGWITEFVYGDSNDIFYGVNLNTAFAMVPGPSAGALFGTSIAAVGDLDGDGFDDVAIGAPGLGGNGDVRVILGSALLSTSPRTIDIPGTHPGGEFGFVVADAGDVNGDGRHDLAIGEPSFPVPTGDVVGAAWVYRGASATAVALVGSASGISLNGRFGASIAAIGDVGNDGFGDILAGAPHFGDDSSTPVVEAGAAGLIANIGREDAGSKWTVFGDAGGAFGATVLGVPDMNGDGLRDAVVSAPGEVAGVIGHTWLYVTVGDGPSVSAGYPLASTAGTTVVPGPVEAAGLSPLSCHRCVWNWGDASSSVIDACTAENAGSVSHVFANAGTYDVRLRIECNDGRESESLIRAEIAPVP